MFPAGIPAQKEELLLKDAVVSLNADKVLRPAIAQPTVELSAGARNFPLPAAQKKDAPRVRLEFLDGLRGLAALYVVLSHVWLAERTGWNPHAETGYVVDPGLPHGLHRAINLLQYGHYAVVIFIALSGFCLMLPVARSSEGTLKDGAANYFKRRFLRILPPYYAAFGLLLLLIALVPGMHKAGNGWWSLSLPAFTPGVIVSHCCWFTP